MLQLYDDQGDILPPDVGKQGGLEEAARVKPAKGGFSPDQHARLAGQILNLMLVTATRIVTVVKVGFRSKGGKSPG